MATCPYCRAEYSTDAELRRHLESTWEHLRERLDSAETALQQCYTATEIGAEYRCGNIARAHFARFPPPKVKP